MELIDQLEGFVRDNLPLLTPVEQSWQPTDYLPDLGADDWADRLGAFRESARGVSDELLVILVGNMITEEALPSYAMSLNRVVRDGTGIEDRAWAQWLRGWTAEENRHGDLLNAYLRMTGRVDMRSVEVTIHHLIRNGFTPKTEGNDVAGLVYAAFQERATRITHGNVAKMATAQGESNLAKICRKISGDETRHETFYTRVIARAAEMDPEAVVLAFRHLLRGIISMPGRKMFDGQDPDLFDHFAAISQRTGAYTVGMYAQIIAHFVDAWKIGQHSLSGKAAKAQDYLCRQSERYEFFAGEMADGLANQPRVEFSWLRGVPV